MPGPETIQPLFDGPATAPTTVILAHGAGASMDTAFMEFFAHALAEGGLRVVRFEFPYMAQRRLGGPRRPPDREDVLRQTWLEVIRQFRGKRLVIGGKSLGGRIAVTVKESPSVIAAPSPLPGQVAPRDE